MTDEIDTASSTSAKQRLSRAKRMARPPDSATGDIDHLFERIRTIAPPTKVDSTWAASFGLADAPKILTWLGLAVDGGVPDPDLWNRVRLPPTRQEALAIQVHEAYRPIFDQIDVEEASQQDIEGAFATQYGLGDTRRYVRAFGAFARHAGIQINALEPKRGGSAQANVEGRPPKSASAKSSAAPIRQPSRGDARPNRSGANSPVGPAGITLNVEIPSNWSEEEIRARLAAVRRAMSESEG